jgi:hypothetical protein
VCCLGGHLSSLPSAGVVGALITYFFVPDMTGVDLADEDARFMEYLERNGWEGVVGEDGVVGECRV